MWKITETKNYLQYLKGEKLMLSRRHYHQFILHLYIIGNYDRPIKYIQSRMAIYLREESDILF